MCMEHCHFNSHCACLKIPISNVSLSISISFISMAQWLFSLTFLSTERKGKESAAMKADLLRARDMKRYINQLTVAKKQCEKRIRLLGGPNYENNEEGGADDSDEPQSQKVRLV